MRLGIIDIGYNAIRAVVYENNTIGSPEIFNHKFKNDILSLLANEELEVKHQAYLSIQYIIHVFNRLGVDKIKCVATAILRDHPRATEFVEYIKSKFNFDIEIISGQREAYLTATGLCSGIENTHGIAADLGGGSLELTEINKGKIGELHSLELGTKVIEDKNIGNVDTIIDLIKDSYNDQTYDNLYLIGGALRFISKFFINFTHYPIKNLHNLEVSSYDFVKYLDKIQITDEEKHSGRKRISNNAVLVAKAMIEVFKPETIIVSTFGLKEGVRFELLDKSEQQKDIILEKTKYGCFYDESITDFDSYFSIIAPLLSDDDQYRKILKLSIMLSSLDKYFDHTLPPTGIAESLLSSETPFPHKVRVMLALIFSYSSNFMPDAELIKISKKLISKEDHNNSKIIGHFIRIAKDIDGPVFSKPTFDIKIQNHYLEIESQEILPGPIFKQVCSRLKSIAFARKSNYNLSQYIEL